MRPQNVTKSKIHDISILISPDMPVYPGDPAVTFPRYQAISKGDLANVSEVCLGTHTGTHIDAPYHVDSSWPKLEDLDLAIMLGPAMVFDLDVTEAITADDISGFHWDGIERVLFKTRNSRLWNGQFQRDFVYLAADGAQFLTQNTKIRLVGIDYLSIEEFGAKQLTTHLELLGHGIVVVEGLNLSQVSAGEYDLLCLPLKLDTPDAAPVRAILAGR